MGKQMCEGRLGRGTESPLQKEKDIGPRSHGKRGGDQLGGSPSDEKKVPLGSNNKVGVEQKFFRMWAAGEEKSPRGTS